MLGTKTVGTTAVQLTTQLPVNRDRSVQVKALSSNTANVSVSLSSSLVFEAADTFILEPGSNVIMQIQDVHDVYMISDTANQKVSFSIS